MAKHSFEDKIKQSLDGFEDSMPPTLAEWSAVTTAIDARKKRKFGAFFRNSILGLLVLLFLGGGLSLYLDNKALHKEIDSLKSKFEKETSSSESMTQIRDTVIIEKISIDTIYIVDGKTSGANVATKPYSNSSSKLRAVSQHYLPSDFQDFGKKTSSSENSRIEYTKAVSENHQAKLADYHNDANVSSFESNQTENSEQQIAEVVSSAVLPDTMESTALIDSSNNKPKKILEVVEEDVAEEPKQKLESSFYAYLSGTLAKPFGQGVKETMLARFSGEIEWRLANRIGLGTGFQLGYLTYEHRLNPTILSVFPEVDQSYYDLYTTVSGLNLPVRLKVYVLPDKTLTPFLSFGLINSVWKHENYKFTDSQMLDDTVVERESFLFQPQFALFGFGMTIFNQANFGSEVELQYNHSLSKSGVADPGMNAIGASLRLFYRL